MTPKEKAESLVGRFAKMNYGLTSEYIPDHIPDPIEAAKQCALIVVDEQIRIIGSLNKPEYVSFITKLPEWDGAKLLAEPETMDGYELMFYLEQVKIEIENL